MLIRALLILAIGFAVLLLTRISAARRRSLMMRWPAIGFALAAIWELSRGGLNLALVCGGLAILSWYLGPRLLAPRPAGAIADDAADREARSVLGVSATASEAEIRGAYRAKMAAAHPDRGGSAAEAARISSARDRLLGKNR